MKTGIIKVPVAGSALTGLFWPGNEHWSAAGPMNSGHEQLTCDSCHRPAPGTVRQQLQANVRFAIGLRTQPVDFGERAVENAECLSCHERPFDRHPVSRLWTLSVARVRHWTQVSRSLFSLHENLGAFGPALLYLHASKWGFGYLGILTGALFANHALGIVRTGALLPRWSVGLWTVLHIALSIVLVALAGCHVWQAYYRE